MRVISAFFMVMLLLLPILLRLGLLGHYQLNRAEITRLHCINRDKPAMHCKGKCYLRSQLEKAQREQESMEGIFAGWDKWEEWLPMTEFNWQPCQPTERGDRAETSHHTMQGLGFRSGVFRPPPLAGSSERLSLHGKTMNTT
jgi:hypothetical protein